MAIMAATLGETKPEVAAPKHPKPVSEEFDQKPRESELNFFPKMALGQFEEVCAWGAWNMFPLQSARIRAIPNLGERVYSHLATEGVYHS